MFYLLHYVLQVWAGPLSGNRLVVGLWNRCSKAVSIKAAWDVLGIESSVIVSVRDLWKVSKLPEWCSDKVLHSTHFTFWSHNNLT